MITFLDITIRNFLSYGNVPTTLILNNQGTTLIQGEDMDNTEQGAGANGTGKSVWLNAIAYALYDKPISTISKDDLVNNVNKKNMEVTVNFKKDDVTYTVRRFRKSKTGNDSNYSEIFKDNVDITPAGATNINQEIENIIGIPYDLFVRVIAFTTKQPSFLSLPVRSSSGPNQSDMIEELFQLKQLSVKADILKDQIKENEQRLKVLISSFDQSAKEHERHSNQIATTNQRIDKWYDDTEKQIIDYKSKISVLSKVNVEEQKEYHKRCVTLSQSLQSVKTEQKTLENQIREYSKTKKQRLDEIAALKEAKCPYCKQDFSDTASKMHDCENDVTSSTALIEELSDRLSQLLDSRDSIETELSDVQPKITIKNYDELLTIANNIINYKQRIKEMQTAENPHEATLKELVAIKLPVLDSSQIDELQSHIDHQKFLLKLLTKKDSFVRKTLINKNIPFLNKQLSKYLSDLGLPHTVEFTHEMTAKISQFGRELSFGNLSSGQEARVNIALSLAFRDVLQSMHEHINVCMFDEVLDVGLDGIGVQLAAKLLKRKAKEEKLSLFIVSHRDEINSSFDRKMVVQFTKGFSYIKFEDE